MTGWEVVTRGEGSLSQELLVERTDHVDGQGSETPTALAGKEDISSMRLGGGY